MPNHKTFVIGDRVKLSSKYSPRVSNPITEADRFVASLRGMVIPCDCPGGPSLHDDKTVHVLWDRSRIMGDPKGHREERCYIFCLLPETEISVLESRLAGIADAVGSYLDDGLASGSAASVTRQSEKSALKALDKIHHILRGRAD